MWHEARANEKRIKELMVDHKKRAERRRAFYESRLGDPKQLLRVIGSSAKLYPDAEQFYYHENPGNLMPWQGNTDIRIDRFDGRSLLDYVPERKAKQTMPVKEQHMMDELNFERYHDLVEADRLKVTERERLNEVEEEWTKLLERHKALLAMLNNTKKLEKGASDGYAYDYGTTVVESNGDLQNEEESQLLRESDILQYVDDLTDKDKKTLNDMASKYGIRNYSRLLRMTKRDRDEQLRELKAKQGKDGGKSKDKGSNDNSRRSRDERSRRRRRRSRYDRGSPSRGGRSSPTYEPYHNSSESDSSAEEDENSTQSEVVIEFGTSSSNVPEQQQYDEESVTRVPSSSSRDRYSRERRKTSIDNHHHQQQQQEESKDTKKLTPMEKLRLKMREGLEKQIDADEKEKKRQEREMELNVLRGSYKGDRDIPGKQTSASSSSEKRARRYYSPSGSSESDRSPSPHRKRRYRSPSDDDNEDDHHGSRQKTSRHRRRSPSVKRSKHRSRSRSPSNGSSRRRYSSSSHHKSSHNSSSSHHRHHDHHHHSSSSRSSRRRSRSRSRSRSSRHKRR